MPHPFKLVNNYRSHRQVLSLASAFTNLMTNCYPEGTNKMAQDRGIANGPMPGVWEG